MWVLSPLPGLGGSSGTKPSADALGYYLSVLRTCGHGFWDDVKSPRGGWCEAMELDLSRWDESPNGAFQGSPGHRPGNTVAQGTRALKGRPSLSVWMSARGMG